MSYFSFNPRLALNLFLTSLILFSVNLHADSPVWKVSNNDQHLYIGGTVHLLGSKDYPLPTEFDLAYKQSSKLILETDISQMQTASVQKTLMTLAMYKEGETIQSRLSPHTYQELKDFCKSRSIDIQGLLRFKPGLLSVILSLSELKKLNLAGTGVDELYNLKARQHNKAQGYLESLNEQIKLISDMGQGQEDAFIQYTLNEMKNMEAMLDQLKAAWRHGDLRELNDIAIKPLKKDFPKLYQAMLVKRNNAWLPQIEEMLTTGEVELILVGALHLAGEDGLLTQLELAGFKVENLTSANDP